MKWHSAPLSKVAPASSSNLSTKQLGEEAWNLTLDQIEADTGRMVNKRVCTPSKAGTSTYVFDEGNVLYSKLRPYLNKVACPDDKGIATTELVPLRPRSSVLDRKYLTYYLRSRDFVAFASQAVAGVKMPRVIMSKFWAHEIPLPPPSEQRKIVELLDQADALRKRRAEADKKAERILPALFYKMFGDPATNPMGWRTGTLSNLCTEDKTVVDVAKGHGVPYIGLEHIESHTGCILVSQQEALDIDIRGLSFAFSPEHILYGKLRPYLNKVVLPSFHGRCSTELVPLAPKPTATREFVAAFLRLPYVVQAAIGTSKGARMPRTDMKLLMSLPAFMPPHSLCRQFSANYHAVNMQAVARTLAKERMVVLFDSMLHRAFTGDLTAKWRQAHMKELLREMEIQARELGIEGVEE